MSPVIDVLSSDGRARGVEAAVAAVRAGQLVVLPTDTVYGIGCDAFDAGAVERLLAAKGRDRSVPPPVLIGDARTVDGLATEVPAYARALIERHWPGPLTLILKAQPSLAWDLGDTGGTVALRMPDLDVTRTLLTETGPMAVTSANRHGHPPATTLLDAATQLGSAVEVYLDGGIAPGGVASTIVDCTATRPVVLRAGPISVREVEAVLAPPSVGGERPAGAADAERPADADEADEAVGAAGFDDESVDGAPAGDATPRPPVEG